VYIIKAALEAPRKIEEYAEKIKNAEKIATAAQANIDVIKVAVKEILAVKEKRKKVKEEKKMAEFEEKRV